MRWLALATLLLVPTTLAASAPFDLEVSWTGPLAVEGAREARATGLTVDLAGEPVALSWASAEGTRVIGRWRSVEPAIAPSYAYRERMATDESPLRLGPGALDEVECGERCTLLAWGDADLDVARLSLAPGGVGRTFCAQFCESDRAAARHDVAAEALAIAGEAQARGDLTLLVADARIVAAGETIDTRRAGRPTFDQGGARVEEYELSFVRLRLTGATLAWVDAPARADAVAASFDGRLDARATGEVSFAGERRAMEDDALAVEGAGELVARGVARRALVGADGSEARLEAAGSASAAQVGPARIEPRGAVPTSAPWLAAAALGAIALALWPFYSRIRGKDALHHPKRRAIHDRLRTAEDGMTTPELARATGFPTAVVDYHLRILQAHRLVVTRRRGAARVHMLPERAPSEADVAQWTLLADPTRRRIAEAVEGRALTQREAAAAAGVSRRLAAYHLARLREAGLVRVEPTFPARYRRA